MNISINLRNLAVSVKTTLGSIVGLRRYAVVRTNAPTARVQSAPEGTSTKNVPSAGTASLLLSMCLVVAYVVWRWAYLRRREERFDLLTMRLQQASALVRPVGRSAPRLLKFDRI